MAPRREARPGRARRREGRGWQAGARWDGSLSLVPLRVVAMQGLGDSIHQRALVRYWMREHAVWLDSAWPSVYHDLVGERLKLMRPSLYLRTQAKNVERQRAEYVRERFVRARAVRVS